MPLNVAIQMDPIQGINPAGDSTLRLGIEAQRRGHTLYYYLPPSLALHSNGELTALAHPITLQLEQPHFTLGDAKRLNLREMDIVLMRQDPPFDMSYMTASYLLERLMPHVLVVNNPLSLRNCPEKLFPLEFSGFMPPTLVTADIAAIQAFWCEHKDIVIKPLYGFGGHSVFRIGQDGANLDALLEHLLGIPRAEPLVAQQYLPEVTGSGGDRRILMIDGEAKGVFGRIPSDGSIRANIRVGGKIAKAELTPRQQAICAVIGPVLRERRLLFVGLDVIGDWLTEINVTSPTGLAAYTALTGIKLEEDIWDAIERNKQHLSTKNEILIGN